MNNEDLTPCTRGYGFLEGFLTRKRSRIADSLIPSLHRKGRILDIGCGRYPFFLLNTDFRSKFGLDKVVDASKQFQDQEITFVNYDLEKEEAMPFASEYFDVVTMLAVFEHLDRGRLVKVLSEVHRILKSGGVYVMTTPAAWAKDLLKLMARLRLVSRVEIEEHKGSYSRARISSMLQEVDFRGEKLQFGYFEMFLNTWAVAVK